MAFSYVYDFEKTCISKAIAFLFFLSPQLIGFAYFNGSTEINHFECLHPPCPSKNTKQKPDFLRKAIKKGKYAKTPKLSA